MLENQFPFQNVFTVISIQYLDWQKTQEKRKVKRKELKKCKVNYGE